MLCSDGFRHEITPEEIGEGLQPEKLLDEHKMQCCATELVEKTKCAVSGTIFQLRWYGRFREDGHAGNRNACRWQIQNFK